MKKIVLASFTMALLMVAPLFLSSAENTPVDFAKLNKAIALFNEAADLNDSGQTVKSKKKRDEAHKITDALFKPGKTMTVNENCYIRKVEYEQNMFELSCAELEEGATLRFAFNTFNDKMWGVKKNLTSDAVLEIYQEKAEGFTGKIQFLEGEDSLTKHAVSIYDEYSKNIPMVIHCKILSLKPLAD